MIILYNNNSKYGATIMCNIKKQLLLSHDLCKPDLSQFRLQC